jgi:oligopeptide/dipeptide ABC transporter ATP-binding protein
MPLLEIEDLRIEFGSGTDAVRAVDGVSLRLDAGQVLGLVGESGSGKSVTALSIARLLPSPPVQYVGGAIRLGGRDVLRMSDRELRRVRGGWVSYVFQEPGTSLNPVYRVGAQIAEVLRYHRPESATVAEVIRLLERVGIPAPETRRLAYPHELSGGMQQRVMIAMALAAQPQLLVADEPTTALDVTIQAQIVELLGDLRRQLGMAILLITHNLGVVADLAETVAVLYAGQIVEQGPTGDLLRRPLHPYTQALVRSVPALGSETQRLVAIPGQVPAPDRMPAGCRFHPRCPRAQPLCATEAPALEPVAADRLVRCLLWNEAPASTPTPAQV